MNRLVGQIADSLKARDRTHPVHKHFDPGVGPFGEVQLVRILVDDLRRSHPEEFDGARTPRTPDILVPGRWAIEVKLARPFGDNGRPAEHWSENPLHPYAGNVSALGDCMKLRESGLSERKGVIVIAYEHSPPRVDTSVAVRCFELIAREILALRLGDRAEATVSDLVHPVHQRAVVYGWELA
ncbi:MAG: hypothetical protein FJZ92_10530 [Chloroflexi bacterium]|nr:hypothetical protein [Chloroflexota bacterium]